MENKSNEEQKEKPASNGAGAGDNTAQADATPLIQSANSAAERMEKAASELKRENERRESILAREMLGGRSSGNAAPEQKPETAKEYAKRIMSGDIRKV